MWTKYPSLDASTLNLYNKLVIGLVYEIIQSERMGRISDMIFLVSFSLEKADFLQRGILESV